MCPSVSIVEVVVAVLILKRVVVVRLQPSPEFVGRYSCNLTIGFRRNSDVDLIVAIQEGIEKALSDNGIENRATASIKNALIRYFENDENKQSFDIYASGSYKDVLGGDRADDILKKLKSYEEDALRTLISKLFKVYSVRGGFSMNTGELCDWIREVIEKNKQITIATNQSEQAQKVAEQENLKQVKDVFKDYRSINKELLEAKI